MNRLTVEAAYRMGGGLHLDRVTYSPAELRAAARVLRRNTRTHAGDYRIVYLACAERLEIAAVQLERAS